MDWNQISAGFLQVFQIENFLYISIGTLLGIIFGAIPGLSGGLAMIIFLPFSFTLGPIAGISMLIAMYCGGSYGGSISAILLGTPGSNEAAASVLDGYPLAKKGYGKKALDIALVASTIGGLVSALALICLAPTIASLTLKFSSPEYFCLTIFGLSIIAGVSGDSLLKGLFAGCLGIFISLIGIDSLSGVPRFTFQNVNLYSGIKLVPFMLGIFAIQIIASKMENKEYNQQVNEKISLTNREGITKRDFKRILKPILKSSLIGVGIGALPGTGAAIAAFIGYNEAKRTSRFPEEFGNGSIEGIAAPEASNNAVTGAALIPLLTLSIPGSSAVAVLIGALTMHGLVPGASLFKNQGTTVYAIMFCLIFTNIIMFVLGKGLSRFFAKVIQVPQMILIPILVIFCFSGACAEQVSVFNIHILVVAGIFAYLLTKLDIPPVPLLLGVILGPIAETNLRNSMSLSAGSWLIFIQRPISLCILIMTVVLIIVLRKQDKKLKNKMKEGK